jgi:NAD(P)-dependent dehydrogenase (short-subunit alcohol dehydrogenase family)
VSSSLEQKKVVIAGGSGFLGVSLAHHLAERGATVVILSRGIPKAPGPWRHVTWDGRTVGVWREELEEAVGLVNLAGRSVEAPRGIATYAGSLPKLRGDHGCREASEAGSTVGPVRCPVNRPSFRDVRRATVG